MKLAPFPSPRILVRRWENGEIEREEMQRLMAEHQYALLEEAEEVRKVRKNPVASYVEGLMSKRAAKKLIRAHGEAGIRELLLALSEVENFLPSAYLWNAMHWDVPLYCFIRTKRAPIFRVKEMWVKSDRGEMSRGDVSRVWGKEVDQAGEFYL